MNARTFVPDLYAGMNGTERRRAIELEALKRTGQIAAWWYERLTLKLADDTRYTPDFLILHLDGMLELDEVKGGFIREDAHVKIKLAAELYPFVFTMHKEPKKGAPWILKDFTQRRAA